MHSSTTKLTTSATIFVNMLVSCFLLCFVLFCFSLVVKADLKQVLVTIEMQNDIFTHTQICSGFPGMGDETNYDLYPDKAYQVKWLRNYLEAKFTIEGRSPSEVTDLDIQRLYVQTNKCACVSPDSYGFERFNLSLEGDFRGQ